MFGRPKQDCISLREQSGELASRLQKHVDVLAGLIGPRHPGKPHTMDAAAAYVEKQLAASGGEMSRQTYTLPEMNVSNIILERRGTTRADEIVIVGAHYDTVPETPGADDNASAVAMLIEVARLLAGVKTKRTVRFVSFPCEEPPNFYTQTMGSDQYARGCHERKEKIVGMICLEMVGYFSDDPESQRCPEEIPKLLRRFFPRRGDFLAAVGNMHSIPLVLQFRRGFKRKSNMRLYSINLPEKVHSIRLSDHSSFWDYGFPALMVTDTSFFRNPNYHKASDLPATLNYPKMAEGCCGVAGAVAQIARVVRG